MDALPSDDDTPSDGNDAARPQLRLVGASPEGAPAHDADAQLGLWIVAVALHHDRDAFAGLFRHFAPRMKGWLWRTGSSADEAEEIVQDAFVNLWRKAAQFDPARASVGAWLFTIARNLRVDRRRAIHDTWTTLDDGEVAAIPDTARSQEDAVDRRQLDERVRLAMATLTEDQRVLVQLSFYEDMSHSHIAAQLDLPLGTVKSRLRRAAGALRKLLEECRP